MIILMLHPPTLLHLQLLFPPTLFIAPLPLPLSQFNSAARQLIELDKPSDSSGDSGEGASSGPQSNGAQRAGEKKNSKKRHSFTSLTMSHKPMLAPPPQRHSMEISGPVLISSSNPTAAARIGEISGGLSCSAPSQVRYATGRRRVKESACSPQVLYYKLFSKCRLSTESSFAVQNYKLHSDVIFVLMFQFFLCLTAVFRRMYNNSLCRKTGSFSIGYVMNLIQCLGLLK